MPALVVRLSALRRFLFWLPVGTYVLAAAWFFAIAFSTGGPWTLTVVVGFVHLGMAVGFALLASLFDPVPLILDETGVSVARAGPGRSRLAIPWRSVEAVFLHQGHFLCVRPFEPTRWLPPGGLFRWTAKRAIRRTGAPYGFTLRSARLDPAATLYAVWRLSAGRVRVGDPVP